MAPDPPRALNEPVSCTRSRNHARRDFVLPLDSFAHSNLVNSLRIPLFLCPLLAPLLCALLCPHLSATDPRPDGLPQGGAGRLPSGRRSGGPRAPRRPLDGRPQPLGRCGELVGCGVGKCGVGKCGVGKCGVGKCDVGKCSGVGKCDVCKCDVGKCSGVGKCDVGGRAREKVARRSR